MRNRRTMSDAELKRRIERLELEKRFKDLTRSDIYPGRVAVENVLKTSGTIVAKNAASGGMAYAAKIALEGKTSFNVKELSRYIFPNPNQKKK